jgi:hypothetical protein
MRFLIANLVFPERRANFANINELVPDSEAQTKRRLDQMPRPRYIKSHQCFDPHYPKVIYVVRDPRDVALSQYNFHRKRKLLPDGSPLQKFVTSFVAGETSPYGSWGEHITSWLATRHRHPGFLLIRYEDMVTDATQELRRISEFLGIPADQHRLIRAAERSSADEMRKLESSQAGRWSTTKDTRRDIPFVRSAKSGNWKSELPESSVSIIESAWGPIMKWLGYELASHSVSDLAKPELSVSLLNGTLR